MNEQDAVTALVGLAQAQRLRVFRALVGAGPAGMTPGTLAALLDTPASTLSFHLKELMHAQLVTQQREGRHLIYRPVLDRMVALIAYLSAHCCEGAGTGCELPVAGCAMPVAAPSASPAVPSPQATPSRGE